MMLLPYKFENRQRQTNSTSPRRRRTIWSKPEQIRDKLSVETDPSKLDETYAPQFKKVQDDSAALITNPRARELWTLKTNPDVTGHVLAVGDKTFDLQKTGEIAGTQQKLDDIRNAALKTSDPASRAAFIKTGQQLIGGLKDAGYIDAVTEQKYRTKWTQDYAIGAVSILPPEEQIKILSPTIQGRDAILDRIGGVENATGNPAARNPNSSAMGNFQFTNKTWLDTIEAHRPDLLNGRSPQAVLDLRADPKMSREMAGYLTDDNAAVFRNQGIAPTPSNLYLAHFLGVDAASKVLKAPTGTPVSDIVSPEAIAANKSVLQGKTVDTVAAWASQKMGGATKGKGDLIDFIPEDQRVTMLHTATEQVAANGIDGARRTQLQTQQIKDMSDARELETLSDIYSASPKLNANSIIADGQKGVLTREAVERLLPKAKAALDDANSKADKTYGPGFYETYKMVHLPEGTPGRITDPSQLYARVGPNGDLTVAGVDKLVNEIQSRKTPEGVAESEMKKQFLANAKGQISGSDEGLHIKDPKGDLLYLKFLAYALPAYDAARKEGKSPVQLLNPDSPDYLGKVITAPNSGFKRPMDQWFSDIVQDSPTHVGKPAEAQAFDPKVVKSLDDLVSAYRSGKVTKAVADQMAIDNGWAAKRASPTVPISGDATDPNFQAGAPGDAGTHENRLTDLMGITTPDGTKEKTSTAAPGMSFYPTVEDAKNALASGYGYGTGIENFLNAKNATVIGSVDADGKWSAKMATGYTATELANFVNDSKFSKNLDLDKPENWGLKEKLGVTFTRASLAAEHIPIAKLGFDPNRIALDLFIGDKHPSLGGSYSEKTDGIYANIDKADPSSVLHEAIHRGIKIAKDKSPEARKIMDGLPNEEYVVRYIMQSMAGDPESANGGNVSDSQRSAAIKAFSGPSGGDFKVRLNRLMDIAAEIHKDQRPRGPR
jgi:hypothetical protein